MGLAGEINIAKHYFESRNNVFVLLLLDSFPVYPLHLTYSNTQLPVAVCDVTSRDQEVEYKGVVVRFL